MPEHRIVGFADILGFKSLVKTAPLGKIAEKILCLIDRSEHRISGIVNFELGHAHFSDAVLLWGPDMSALPLDKQQSIRKSMMMVVSSFMQGAVEDGIPIRMGVAEGSVIIDHNRSIYIGQPIVDAYGLESAQEWVGGAIHESVKSQEELIHPHCNVVEYQIPSKDRCKFSSHVAINWHYYANRGDGVSTESLRQRIVEMRQRAKGSLEVIKKYDNSLKFLDYVSKNCS